ncbi:hypothetical protein DET49_111114 [Salegentibacter sp. 24]|uniref:hypothetical protein n=1 Tax=Salegentibacter sp. 24 TaxID=2183986 RepID=UPI001060890B|nr:hypothetical protein [Salegentibacter sp. 24]TDN87666.1 hypothetical protein DET49_111114 [Salegentibacter sp. 24]
MNVPLTDKQKERLHILEPKLNQAIQEQDFSTAKNLVVDIQKQLRPTKHFVRLVQSKNKLYELSIELNKCDFALNGLLSNQKVIRKNTRIHLETTSLIAICYLRMRDVEKAKNYIQEVLRNHTVIKTQRTREAFHTEIINRFNEEVALATLTSTQSVHLDEDEVERESIRIIQTMTDDEIFSQIGQSSPSSTKSLLFLVYDYSTKQLPSAERLALPSPDQKVKDKEVGLTVFESIKRVVYNSLCNPESEIYKAWFNNGVHIFLSKGYIKSAVVSCLVNIGFSVSMIAASIVALITKFGIEVYCTKYKPIYVSDIRKK